MGARLSSAGSLIRVGIGAVAGGDTRATTLMLNGDSVMSRLLASLNFC